MKRSFYKLRRFEKVVRQISVLDQSGTVKSYQTAAGYAIPNGTTASYYYQVKDWLGTAHVTLDAAGGIKNAMDYYPYGKKLPGRNWFSTNQEGYRYQFTGHEMDGETGYQYHGARYYNEELVRYMAVDPWADKYPNWSTYNYVMGNPLIFIDPTGKGVEYTKKEALEMAARGKDNEYETKVVENPNKPGDYGVNYKKTVKGKKYEGVQYEGKFKGISNIGKEGVVKQGEIIGKSLVKSNNVQATGQTSSTPIWKDIKIYGSGMIYGVGNGLNMQAEIDGGGSFSTSRTESSNVFGTSGILDMGGEIGLNIVLSHGNSRLRSSRQVSIGIGPLEYYYSTNGGESGINFSSGFSLMGYICPVSFNAETIVEK